MLVTDDVLKAQCSDGVRHRYAQRDTMLYAPGVGMDVSQFLHGEQRLTLHRPFLPKAELLAEPRHLPGGAR